MALFMGVVQGKAGEASRLGRTGVFLRVGLDEAIEAVRREEQYRRMGALDDDGEPRAYERARHELLNGLRFIRLLRHHRCEWTERDYCRICGADGRA